MIICIDRKEVIVLHHNQKKYLFLNENLNYRLTGIEQSSLLRAKLFFEQLDITPYILTVRYNNNLEHVKEHLKKHNILHERVPVINMYEYFQETKKGQTQKTYLKNNSWTYKKVANTYDYRVYYKDTLIKYKKYLENKRQINFINYFSRGKKVQRNKYDANGYLSVSQALDNETERVIMETYYRTDGTPCIIKHYYYVNNKRKLDIIYLLNRHHQITNIFHKEKDLIAFWLQCLFDDKTSYYCFVDKNRWYYSSLIELNLPNVNVIPVIHSLHIKGNKNVFTSKVNSNYTDIFKDVTKPEAIVILTNKQKQDIEKRFGIKGNYHVIPHSFEHLPERVLFEKRLKHKVVAVARYSSEKQLDQMITIFAEVVKKIPTASLDIYGYGREAANLQQQIKQLNMEENIQLKPYTDDVGRVFETASLSLLTSRVEAFSLVIMESLSHGCPVISYDIKYGPSEMIKNGRNGFLVPIGEKTRFANKIIKVLQTPSLNKSMSEQAYNLIHPFQASFIAKRWKKLLNDIKD